MVANTYTGAVPDHMSAISATPNTITTPVPAPRGHRVRRGAHQRATASGRHHTHAEQDEEAARAERDDVRGLALRALDDTTRPSVSDADACTNTPARRPPSTETAAGARAGSPHATCGACAPSAWKSKLFSGERRGGRAVRTRRTPAKEAASGGKRAKRRAMAAAAAAGAGFPPRCEGGRGGGSACAPYARKSKPSSGERQQTLTRASVPSGPASDALNLGAGSGGMEEPGVDGALEESQLVFFAVRVTCQCVHNNLGICAFVADWDCPPPQEPSHNPIYVTFPLRLGGGVIRARRRQPAVAVDSHAAGTFWGDWILSVERESNTIYIFVVSSYFSPRCDPLERAPSKTAPAD
ncbi:hypothetical protein HYPSUDRAFT_1104910 [Hypholoma sublateritium FD-334 SS-4]|uniref:Uncharacterized protein n=1 Tax=Hypholoma sublateritium (strain FD-334 SS-4) TaxID=945553 RepID=A0A0D2NKN8_HYPSF|nr:hypothetical protein HYPSUDRAFT_1104910 [Hypholoma sublateritium FD-334 SS-4]